MQIDEQSFTPPRPTFTVTPIMADTSCDICQSAKVAWTLTTERQPELRLCLACCLRQQIALMTINS